MLLQALDDTGMFKIAHEDTLALSLSGAILMNLAPIKLIDTDLKNLIFL